MKIKYFNVSSFLITTEKGVRIITDPYQYNYQPANPPPDFVYNRPAVGEYADVIAISHTHGDHSYVWGIKGTPQLYTGGAPVEIKGVKFRGLTTWHDDYGETTVSISTHGINGIIGIEADGIRIWHMGDFGIYKLTDEQLNLIGRVDILMTPWDMPQALQDEILSQLKPKVVFPMHHFRVNEHLTSQKGFIDYRADKVTEVELKADTLPSKMKFFLLEPSLEY